MATQLTPLKDLKVTFHQIPAHHLTPNTSLHHRPLLIYHSAFPPSMTPSAIDYHLRAINVVAPQWRFTMYSTTHFHSTTHEVLCISRGSAKLCFGCEENPGRVEVVVQRGDVVVVPAGVGHRLLEEVRDGDGDGAKFEMVGSYPVGGEGWDMCYGREGEDSDKIRERIEKLAWFERDPVYGDRGPVLDV